MTFSINSKEFLKALNFAGKTIPNTAITPIFECVLLECKKSGTMVVTGSDSNTVIQTKAKMAEFDLEGQELVKIAAPYDLLARTLATLPNVPVSVTYTVEGEIFNMQIDYENEQGRNAIFNMACEDPAMYFRLPTLVDEQTIKLPSQTLQRGIDNVINFVSEDVMMPAITGVNVAIESGKISFTATNKNVIGIFGTVFRSDVEKEVLIPGKFAKLISEFIGENDSDITLKVSDRFIKVHFGDWIAYSTLIEDKFPNCRAVIPTSFKESATINAEDIKIAMKRATVYADPQTSTIKLAFNEKSLFLSAEYQEKNQKCDQDISIESEIEDLKIGFNMKMLSKLLNTVSGDFKMSFVAPNQAVLINPDVAEGETIDYVIMPVVVLS